MARMTVADIRALKGKRQMSMLFVETPDEARAAAATGIDLLSIADPLWTPEMRDAAGDCFVQVGLRYGALCTYFAPMRITCAPPTASGASAATASIARPRPTPSGGWRRKAFLSWAMWG